MHNVLRITEKAISFFNVNNYLKFILDYSSKVVSGLSSRSSYQRYLRTVLYTKFVGCESCK